MTDPTTRPMGVNLKERSRFGWAWEAGLAFRYLRARRRQGGIALTALISFFAIAAAVAVLIIVMSIMSGFRTELQSRTLSLSGHVQVSGAAFGDVRGEKAIEALQAIPGVTHAAPVVQVDTIFRAGGVTSGGRIRGIRPQDLPSLAYVYSSLSPQAVETFSRNANGGDTILIGQGLAEALALRVGDPVTIYSPYGSDFDAVVATGSYAGAERTFRIGGIFRSGTADFDRAFIFMPLSSAQELFDRVGKWDGIEVRVMAPDAVADWIPAIQKVAGPDAAVRDWRTDLAAFWGALKVERVAMSIILGMVVAIAALNIISSIVMLAKNKTHDIAILRTIGASQWSVLRIFFIAGATIGAAGTLAGLTLGLLFCLNIGAIQHFLEGLIGVQLFNADVYMLDAVPALVDPMDVLWVTVWSFFMSCVAGLIPAWQAAKLDPIEAMRYD